MCVCVCVCVCGEREIHFKELASAVVGAGKSETLRAGCQEDEAGNAWAGAEATAHRQKFFLRKPRLGFAHKAFQKLPVTQQQFDRKQTQDDIIYKILEIQRLS